MRVDAHHHLWEINTRDYVWMSGSMKSLRRDFLPPDLAGAVAPVGIEATVAVQARQMVEETAFLLDCARGSDLIQGVVGWVDLRSPAVAQDLDRFAADRKFRGVRHVIHDEADERFILGRDFRRGLAALKKHRLTYDLLVRTPHLSHALEVVRTLPDQPFVIDHIAKPEIAAGVMEPWRQRMAALAERPNVCCKVSGMVTEASWSGWKPADFRPYLETVLEMFGPERLMFGSDWPVCTLAASYEQVFRLVDDWVSALSDSEAGAIMGGTAARFYGL